MKSRDTAIIEMCESLTELVGNINEELYAQRGDSQNLRRHILFIYVLLLFLCLLFLILLFHTGVL